MAFLGTIQKKFQPPAITSGATGGLLSGGLAMIGQMKQRKAESEAQDVLFEALAMDGDPEMNVRNAFAARRAAEAENAPEGFFSSIADRFNPNTPQRGTTTTETGLLNRMAGAAFNKKSTRPTNLPAPWWLDPKHAGTPAAVAAEHKGELDRLQDNLIDLEQNHQAITLERAGITDRDSNRYKQLTRILQNLDGFTKQITDRQAEIRGLVDKAPRRSAAGRAPAAGAPPASSRPVRTPSRVDRSRAQAAPPAAAEFASQPAPGIPEGQTATDPKTGQKIVVENGQWVPVQ